MKPLLHLIQLVTLVFTSASAFAQEAVVHYDNTHLSLETPGSLPPGTPPPFLTPGDTHVAQQFYSETGGAITSVKVALKRTGMPGGILSVEIWDHDATGEPGELVGTLGEVDVNQLPVSLQHIELSGSVTGLTPSTRYYLVLRNVEVQITGSSQTYHNGAAIQGLNGGPGTPHPPDGSALNELLVNSNGQWEKLSSQLGTPPAWLMMRVAGVYSPHILTITSSDHGTVTADPDLETYPAGTEVTLTATPNEGYDFAGWTATKQIGEPEATTVFDNLDHPRDEFNSPLGKDRKFAQQFLMDGATTLAQVELELFRLGSVQGGMAVELWNDEGDDPGEKIADLGTIDDVSTILTNDTAYPFETNVNDLDPQGKYWVVIQFEAITSSLDENNTIGWTYTFSEDGANTTIDAHALRAQDNGKWLDFPQFVGHPRPIMHQMRVQTLGDPVTEELDLPQENPLTITINADTTITPEFVAIPGDVAIYSNIPDPLPPDGLGVWVFPHAGDRASAQPFTTGASGLISSVRLPLIRRGTPGGVVHAEIWTDNAGIPGAKVVSVGDINLETLAAGPGEILQFESLNLQLEPHTNYHFVLENSEAVIVDEPRSTYSFLTDSSDEGAEGAGTMMVTTPAWTPLENFLSHAKYLRFEIMESSETVKTHSLTIQASNGGTATADPDLETYPAGTEVTLTATPNEGYVFTKWVIGEQDFNDNPLTFTIEADTTVTATFRAIGLLEITGIVLDPVARNISLSWPSRPDAVYEIDMSANLVDWELIETKAGTGQLTTVVVSAPIEAAHRFYRLREKP